MELELKRKTLNQFRQTYHAAWGHEEIRECIVSDSLPDVSRIVSVSGHVQIKESGLEEGAVKLNGELCISVLYIPEGESRPKVLSQQIPIRSIKEDPRVSRKGVLYGTMLWIGGDAKLLNPRKILLRCAVSCRAEVYEQSNLELVCDISEQENSIEKRIENVQFSGVREVSEKKFTFSDVLHVSSAKPPVEEILFYRPNFGTPEGKVIGRKLVCKGEMTLSVVYRNGAEIHNTQFEMPYSQVLELSSGYEESEAEVQVFPVAVQVAVRDNDVEAWVEAALQALIRNTETGIFLTDAYSAVGELETEREAYSVTEAFLREGKREQIRYFCESGIPAGQVVDCCITLSEQSVEERDGVRLFCADFRADILYLSEDGALCCVSFNIPYETALPPELDCDVILSCSPAGDGNAVPVTGGLELRFHADVFWTKLSERTLTCVSKAVLNTECGCPVDRPSLVLHYVCRGDDLWSIAKCCSASPSDICAVNGISGDPLQEGAVLLIPTKRLI